jgi:hypothetical protein
MAKQDNADNLIGRQAELTRRQDAVIKNIDADNVDQEKKLQDLDQENDQLASELDQVELRLSMKPQRDTSEPTAQSAPDRSVDKDSGTTTAPVVNVLPNVPDQTAVKKTSRLPAIGTNQPTGPQAFAHMIPQLSAAGNPQKSLFPSDYGQDSANWARSKLKQNAQDVAFRDIYNTDNLSKLAQRELEPATENKDRPEPPEADYGDDYQRMVQRVKRLAGLGPLKTVYDPHKRVYRNVPTAVQPPKK